FACEGEKGNKSFTYDFDDEFPIPCSLGSLLHSLTVACDVYTQENHYLRKAIEFSAPSSLNTNRMRLIISEVASSKAVKINIVFPPEGPRVFLWRKEGTNTVLINTAVSSGNTITMYDYTAEYGKHYTYTALLVKSNISVIFAASADFAPTLRTVKLALLSENGTSYHRRQFAQGNAQIFDIGGEQGIISHSIGADIYEAEGGQPGAVYSSRDYESGNLTVYVDRLGSITAPITSGLDNINALRDFIASKQPFLMVDNVGNARIVALTSVNREFDRFSQMTKMAFGWTEICKIENAIVG
ncbi:MAG: hypothetical protein II388_12325, partial [Clostridia bacterium]|nr:hypothetical protein [Clostridia bacterium]